MGDSFTGDFGAVLQVSDSTVNRLMATLHQNAGNTRGLPSHPHAISVRLTAADSADGVLGLLNAQLGVPRVDLFDRATDRFELRVDVRARFFENPGSAYLPMYLQGEIRATYQLTAIDPRCVGWRKHADDFLWVRVLTDTVRFTGTTSGVADPAVDTRIERVIAHLLDGRFEAAPHRVQRAFRPGRMLSLTTSGRTAVALPLGLDGADPAGDIASIQQVFVDKYDFAVAVDVAALMTDVDALLDMVKTRAKAEATVQVKATVLGGVWETTRDVDVNAAITDVTATWRGSGDPAGSVLVHANGEITAEGEVFAKFSVDTVLSVWFYPAAQFHVVYNWNPKVDVFDVPWLVGVFAPEIKDALAGRIRDAINTALTGRLPLVLSLASGLDVLNRQLRSLDDAAVASIRDTSCGPTSVLLFGRIKMSPRKRPVPHFAKFDDDSFSAFSSWAPGGWIQRFTWAWRFGGSPTKSTTSPQRYVLSRPRNGYSPWGLPLLPTDGEPLPGLDRPGSLCLTIDGYQVDSTTGDARPFSVQTCTRYGHPLTVPGKLLQTLRSGADTEAQPQVIGVMHLGDAQVDSVTANTLVVYSGGRLDGATAETLAAGLGRGAGNIGGLVVYLVVRDDDTANDAGLAETVLALSARVGAHVEVVADVAQSWTARLAIRPEGTAWRLISPNGAFTWSHDGALGGEELTQALDDHLRPGPPPRLRPLGATVAPMTKPPPLVVERPGGPDCPRLRLPTVDTGLIFVAEGSPPSEQQLRSAARRWGQIGSGATELVVIVDGSQEYSDELSRRYPEMEFMADPRGSLAKRFGVHIWPTTIGVDADGLVSVVRHGVVEFDAPLERRHPEETAP